MLWCYIVNFISFSKVNCKYNLKNDFLFMKEGGGTGSCNNLIGMYLEDMERSTKQISYHPICVSTLNGFNIYCNLVSESFVNCYSSHLLYKIPFYFQTGRGTLKYPKDIFHILIKINSITTLPIL